jgi:hypothetical protein
MGLVHATLLAPRILSLLPDFWNICTPPDMNYLLWFGHLDRGFKCLSRYGCVFSSVFIR